MSSKTLQVVFVRILGIVLAWHGLASTVCAQMTPATPGSLSGVSNGLPTNSFGSVLPAVSVEFELRDAGGNPIKGGAVITMFGLGGGPGLQQTTSKSSLVFVNVPQTEYRVQVIAPFYHAVEKRIDLQNSTSSKVVLTLEPLSAEEQALAASAATLPAKAQKDLGKAIEALRANNAVAARGHLDALLRIAPKNAEVNYLYGIYSSKTNNDKDSVSYWSRALEADPRHLRSLLALCEIYLQQKKTDEAAELAKRAAAVDPSSWRAEALLASVAQQRRAMDEVIKHGQRALELGRSEAFAVEPMLAGALAQRGQKDRAVVLLQSYLKDKPNDEAAAKELAAIQSDSFLGGSTQIVEVAGAATEMPLATNWLPPDVDEKMPPVQSAGVCSTADVIANSGKRVEEFVKNLERFTATESLVHHSIDKWGVAAPAIKRKFDYVAAVSEVRPGLFNFDEYRRSPNGDDRFPEGVATDGLPALVMIFHPYYAATFDMKCEGLSSWDGRPVWQIHFRQRPGSAKALRTYKIGVDGPSYAVAMRGRAWISAEDFQVVRLETDLVSPLQQIRLFADHTIIEYAPVDFQKNNLRMWLPHTAEVYFDWRGHRMHRVHSFSNYLLFSVDDKQKISAPTEDGRRTLEVDTHSLAQPPKHDEPASAPVTLKILPDSPPSDAAAASAWDHQKRAVQNFLARVQQRVVSAAEAMPAEKYQLALERPNAGDSPTFAELVRNLADTSRRLTGELSGAAPAAAASSTGDGTARSKDEIVEYVKKSFLELNAAVEATREPVGQRGPAGAAPGKATGLALVSETLVSMFDDYDRLLEYFKASEVAPPSPQ